MSMHQGHRQRMKEEFLARPDSFPDHKLLELLLFYANPRSDTNPTAHALIEQFGSLAGVLDAVVLLKTMKELSRRYLTARTGMDDILQNTDDVFYLLRPHFFGARSERVCVVCLDGKGKNLGVRKISEGSVNAAEVTTRKVMEAAMALNAEKVILAHNHPSGLALPSPEDKATTIHLARVLASVGITLADHVIFTDDDMVSMKDSGIPLI